MMYKKDSYIAFMTNEPQVHFNEMFGHNDLTEDDFEKAEHIGFVKTVIDERNYLVVIVRPILGFRCVINEDDIIRSVDASELTDEERSHREVPEFTAPNVYLCHSAPDGETVDEKCVNCAKEAMAHLFPEEDIAWVYRSWSSYLKSDMLGSIIERAYEGQDAKQEKVDYFKSLLQAMRFKEYYYVSLDVYETPERTSMLCYHIAVDLKFEEVVVMRTMSDIACFVRSLGPEYDIASGWRMKLMYDSLAGKDKRKKRKKK